MLRYDEQEVESDYTIYDTDDARKGPNRKFRRRERENNQANIILLEYGNVDDLWIIENGSQDPRQEVICNIENREDEYSSKSKDDRAEKYVFEQEAESETWLKELFNAKDGFFWRSRKQAELVHKGLLEFTRGR